MSERMTACAVSLAVALAAAGCSAPPEADASTLVFATDVQPDCLDPQVSADDVTALVDRGIFESLVRRTPEGGYAPWLATGWSVSPDGLTYTFSLRRDVRFHDGTPFDADAVRATLDHAVDRATRSQYAAGLLTDYAETIVPGPETAVVRLNRPSGSFLQALSTAYLGIQSPKSLKENRDSLCRHPVGTGPFRFGSWVRNHSIVLVRADDGTGTRGGGPAIPAGAAPVRRLDIRYVPENGVRFGMLTSGQADAIGGLPPDKVSTLRHSPGFQVLSAEAPGVVCLLLLNSGSGPFTDERVRQALVRAVPVDELVQSVYFGQYRRAWGPLSPASPGYDRGVEGRVRHDVAEAGRLLDEAGWTGRDSEGYRTRDGHRLTLRWPFTAQLVRDRRDVLGQGIQAEARRAGIDLAFTNEDSAAYVTDFRKGAADVLSFSFVRGDPDMLRYLFGTGQTVERGGGNVFRLRDPRLDGWLGTGAASSSAPVRNAVYADVQRYLVDHALVLPVYAPRYLLGAGPGIGGLRFDVDGFPLFDGVHRGSATR